MSRTAVASYLMSRQWAMDPAALRSIADQVAVSLATMTPEAMDAARRDSEERSSSAGYDVVDGVAHIPVSGVILKEVPCIFGWFGIAATSTLAVKYAIDEAVADDRVQSISLDIDSPGGSVAGVQELGDAIYAARGSKQIVAHASDLIASAAYWLGCQASQLTANEGAIVGSIGVYTVMVDQSAADEAAGFKVHVIRSHELKGTGAGDAITEAQLAEEQRVINGFADLFVSSVARGRGMTADKARSLATGQVWLAPDALASGLIDAVVSSDEAHARVAQRRSGAPGRQLNHKAPLGAEGSDMNELEELKAEKAAAEAKAEAAGSKAAELDAENKSLRGSIKALEANQREALIAKYENRVKPANLEAVKAYGEFCGTDMKKFEAHLISLPVVTHDTRVSGANEEKDETPTVSADDAEVAELFGYDPAIAEKFKGAKYVERHTGLVVFEDGTKRKVS